MEESSADFDKISAFISSDKSPVGIDAKKTHIFIIDKLNKIEDRLKAIEGQLSKSSRTS